MKTANQRNRVLRHLKDHGGLTQIEAMSEYGIARLAARIQELREDGYEITTERVHGKNRYGESTSYARYVLLEEVPA